MELGIRIVLAAVAFGVLIVILLDGYRKIKSHRNQLRFKLEPIDPMDPADHATDISKVRKVSSSTLSNEDPLEAKFDDPQVAYQHPNLPSATEPRAPLNRPMHIHLPKTSHLAPNAQTANEEEDEAQEAIMLNLLAAKGQVIKGDELLNAILLSGMRFGDKALFHYFESQGATDKAIFSLINIVRPGTFSLQKMGDFTTPGVCLFMSLPGPTNASESFETFLMTAHRIAQQLKVGLFDELHRPLTESALQTANRKARQFTHSPTIA